MSISYWIYGETAITKFIPFKIHVSAFTHSELENVMTLLPELDNKGIQYKYLNPEWHKDYLENNDHPQYGKGLTIYPHSKEEFISIAKWLDENLSPAETDEYISGDRLLKGKSNRVWYRYELVTGEFKDNTFSVTYYGVYALLYQPNRGGDKYLALDMNPEDDPFLDLELN